MQKKLEKLEAQIERNLLRKKELLEKEKKKRVAKFSNIGRLAFRANIDTLDEEVLLGAFLEIAERMQQPENLQTWQVHARAFEKTQNDTSQQVFSVYFEEEPHKDIKQKMKSWKFIYNRYKREYCGKAEREQLEQLLKSCKVKIEEIVHV